MDETQKSRSLCAAGTLGLYADDFDQFPVGRPHHLCDTRCDERLQAAPERDWRLPWRTSSSSYWYDNLVCRWHRVFQCSSSPSGSSSEVPHASSDSATEPAWRQSSLLVMTFLGIGFVWRTYKGLQPQNGCRVPSMSRLRFRFFFLVLFTGPPRLKPVTKSPSSVHQKSYWCLVGNGWEWGNGITIDSHCGSFPHSLLSTSKKLEFTEN